MSSSKLVRLTTNNQVAIPAFIVRDLKLSKGSYLQVSERGWDIVMRPVRVVCSEDFAMYEKAIRKSRSQWKKGKTVAWDAVKKKMDRRASAR